MTTEKRYINHDPRFGAQCEFTIPEMIALYRDAGWDEYTDEDEGGQTIYKTMTDEEIIDDIMQHDIEEI